LLAIVQEHPEIGRELDAAAARWVGAEAAGATLIHGDVRSGNVLVVPPDAGGEAIRLIDWELLAIGDPAWDVAGALQDLLVFWIRGLPLDAALSGEDRVRQAERPLAALHPLFAAFRDSYAAVAGGRVFERAVPFSAVRLLQTVWEWADDVAELPAPAVMMLQVAANVLADPERARVELYGFPEHERR
jgi:aminoglycoside phosphotransferase (APT) family kinase protein